MDAGFARSRKVMLVRSDSPEPRVKLAPGKRYEVVSSVVVDAADQAGGEAEIGASRLCGDSSGNTCVCIIEVTDA